MQLTNNGKNVANILPKENIKLIVKHGQNMAICGECK